MGVLGVPFSLFAAACSSAVLRKVRMPAPLCSFGCVSPSYAGVVRVMRVFCAGRRITDEIFGWKGGSGLLEEREGLNWME